MQPVRNNNSWLQRISIFGSERNWKKTTEKRNLWIFSVCNSNEHNRKRKGNTKTNTSHNWIFLAMVLKYCICYVVIERCVRLVQNIWSKTNNSFAAFSFALLPVCCWVCECVCVVCSSVNRNLGISDNGKCILLMLLLCAFVALTLFSHLIDVCT